MLKLSFCYKKSIAKVLLFTLFFSHLLPVLQTNAIDVLSAPGTPDMASGSDSGTSAIDNETNDTTPTFTVSCDAANTVKLFDGLTQVGSASCASSTATITSSTLSEGVHTITAVQNDGVADSSASSPLFILIDITGPSVTVNKAAVGQNDPTNILNPLKYDVVFSEQIDASTFSGTLDFTGSSLVFPDAYFVSLTTTDEINWDFRVGSYGTFADTYFTIPAGVVTDIAGNDNFASTSTDNSIHTDYIAPVITEVTPVLSGSTDTTPNYTFNTDEAGTISYLGACSSTTTGAVVGNNTITFNPLSAGEHTDCQIGVIDAVGNGSILIALAPFTISQTVPGAPSEPIFSNVKSTSLDIAWEAPENDGGSTITEYDLWRYDGVNGDVLVNTGITLSFRDTGLIPNTEYEYYVIAKNAIGSSSSSSHGIVTPTYPEAPGTPDLNTISDSGISSTDNITQFTELTFTVSCSSDTVGLYDGESFVGTGACIEGSADITSITLGEGLHSINAYQNDGANGGAPSDALVVTIDTSIPDMSEITAVPTPTNDTTPSYTFSGSEAGTITYGGSCSSSDTGAVVGNNTITFDTLTGGT